MLLKYSGYFVNCWLVLILFLYTCAGYAYWVNTKRPADDPKKQDYHPAAIFLAPITLPIFILAQTFLFIIKVLFYGFFLLVFTVGLVVIRKPFFFIWLDKVATYVGTMLLEANTFLIRLFFPRLKEKA